VARRDLEPAGIELGAHRRGVVEMRADGLDMLVARIGDDIEDAVEVLKGPQRIELNGNGVGGAHGNPRGSTGRGPVHHDPAEGYQA
jgi:hypothetical protein